MHVQTCKSHVLCSDHYMDFIQACVFVFIFISPLFVQLCKVNLSEDAQTLGEFLQQISPLLTPESCSRCHVGAGCWQKPGMPTYPNICPNLASPSCEKCGRPLWRECVRSGVCVMCECEQQAPSFHSYADSRAHLFALSAA